MKISTKKHAFTLICLSLLFVSFHAKAQLKAAFTYGQACTQVRDTLIDKTTGGTPPYTYYWDFGNKTSSTAQNTGAAYDTSGTFRVVLHVTDAKGLVDSVAHQITVNDPPRATYTATETGCGVITYNADIAASSSSAITNYTWTGQGSPGFGPLYIKGQSGGYKFARPSTYEYTLTITGASGCSRSYLDSVVVPGFPSISLPNDTGACINGSITLKAAILYGEKPFSIWWGYKSANLTDSVISCTIKKDTTVAVFVRDAVGCFAYDSINIRAISPINAHWAASSFGTTTRFLAAGAGLPDSDYVWSFGDGDSATARTASHIYKKVNNYSISLTVNDSGCKSVYDSAVYIADAGITSGHNGLLDVTVYPNPAYGMATVQYSLSQRTHVALSIYDAEGRQVASFINGSQPAGSYLWDLNAGKYGMGPGIYLLKLTTDEGVASKELILY